MKKTGFRRRFRNSKSAMFGLCFLCVEALAVYLLPVLLRLDPVTSDVRAGFYAVPSAAHMLGTDGAARDLLARTLCGGQVSLFVGVAAPFISVSIGLPLGLAAGYYRGIVETLVMRAADVCMSFPSILLSLMMISVIGPSLATLIGVIGVMGWTEIAKLVYSSVLSIREKDYIDSALSIGLWTFSGVKFCPGCSVRYLCRCRSSPATPFYRSRRCRFWVRDSVRRGRHGAALSTPRKICPSSRVNRGFGCRAGF